MTAVERLHARLWPARGRHHRTTPLAAPVWPVSVPDDAPTAPIRWGSPPTYLHPYAPERTTR